MKKLFLCATLIAWCISPLFAIADKAQAQWVKVVDQDAGSVYIKRDEIQYDNKNRVVWFYERLVKRNLVGDLSFDTMFYLSANCLTLEYRMRYAKNFLTGEEYNWGGSQPLEYPSPDSVMAAGINYACQSAR